MSGRSQFGTVSGKTVSNFEYFWGQFFRTPRCSKIEKGFDFRHQD